jgi:pimeloyl-ACP methyl ester carboxylesterase
MSVIVLNQSLIHYESLGRGRPVLFLHTWVGSWRYWVPSLEAVAVSHSAYALDFFGFGESARGPARYSMESQAELVASFMDEMGIDRIAIVGHGLGGLVGLHFAAMHPGRVARMLVAGLSPRSTPAHESLLKLTPDELLAFLDTRGVFASELLPETQAIDPAAMRLVPQLEEIQRSLSALGTVRSPILIINGANDPLQLTAESIQWAGPEPEPHEIVLPESGHFPMLDASDSFHRLMVDFLGFENGTNVHELRLKEEWRRRMR